MGSALHTSTSRIAKVFGRDLRVRLAVAALLLLHMVLAFEGVRHRSPTVDEPMHLLGGVSYWKLNDYRIQPENGNLPMRWATLPLVLDGVQLPIEDHLDEWQNTVTPVLMYSLLYGGQNDHVELLWTARRAAIVWSLALGVLIFAWARSLWGVPAGLLALTMHALSPTMLAHGALVTSDSAAAFFLLAATWGYWRALMRPSTATLLTSGALTGLCAVAKFSVVLLPFVFLPLTVWALYRRRVKWKSLALLVLANVAIPWLVIWASFGFRYSPVGPDALPFDRYYRLWSDTMPDDGLLRSVVSLAREWRVLPEAYIYGFTHVLKFAGVRLAFLNGEYSNTGWWWFFPYAFLIKSTLAELLLVAVAAVVALRRLRKNVSDSERPLERTFPLLSLLAVYWLFSITSHLNIGHRHLLPTYAPMFILASGLVATGVSAWRSRIALAVGILALVEVFAVRPHYLAYFNTSVGGPSGGWKHLVDSSLDWGQDLPRLADWLREHRQPDEPVFHSVFGSGSAAGYGIEGYEIAPDWPDFERPWIEWTGGVYAISATRLQQAYSPFRGTWNAEMESILQNLSRDMRQGLASGAIEPRLLPYVWGGVNIRTWELLQFARLTNYLRLRQPDDVIAHSIFIHRLSDREVEIAVRGSTEDYLLLIDSVP